MFWRWFFCWWGGHPHQHIRMGLDFQQMKAYYQCEMCNEAWQKRLTPDIIAQASKLRQKRW